MTPEFAAQFRAVRDGGLSPHDSYVVRARAGKSAIKTTFLRSLEQLKWADWEQVLLAAATITQTHARIGFRYAVDIDTATLLLDTYLNLYLLPTQKLGILGPVVTVVGEGEGVYVLPLFSPQELPQVRRTLVSQAEVAETLEGQGYVRAPHAARKLH